MRKLPILAVSMVIACSPISVFAEGEDEAAKRGDTEITARVKAALIENDAASAPQIDVEARNGVVQLSGFVDSEEAQEAALRTARSIDGVTKVRNDLDVREQDRTAGEVVDDTVIAARVKAELADEANLGSSSDVNVEVNNGVVQLSGFVSNVDEKNRAADAVSDVDGVKDVRNNIALAPNER